MNEHLFNAYEREVKNILDNRQTMFRRVMRPQPVTLHKHGVFFNDPETYVAHATTADGYDRHIKCPYGQPGDRLWVRETFRLQNFSCDYGHWSADICYRADESISEHRALFVSENERIGWRPSTHMPRWASRITLEVTGVRVERVKGISLDDIKAEGIGPLRSFHTYGGQTKPYKNLFVGLWDKINAKRGYSWDSNPWVWVIEFKQVAVAKKEDHERLHFTAGNG